MKKRLYLYLVILICSLFGSYTYGQEFNTFEVRYEENLRGDLIFIGNNILNRDSGTAGERPNDPYNNLITTFTGADNNDTSGFFNFNDRKNMQYIDVDGDPTTFNSSTSILNFAQPECNLIRYAGLYWSATYPSATANGVYTNFFAGSTNNTVPIGTGRQTDFNQVKFKVPGGTYVDITADEILFDGFTNADPTIRTNSPYACYADVTSIVTALADPTGEYAVGNIRATTGMLLGQGGNAGGWTLVVVYENPTLTGKFITTFDGFARVNGTNTVDIDYSGFETIPAGPVRADFGASTLEGDLALVGDGLSIRAASNAVFTPVGEGDNPANNFFNSNFTVDGTPTTNRNPASVNTLGYDTDVFELDNTANSIIPNSETAATFRFSTNGDQFYPFFNSFNIEVIEPNIVLEKRVEDIAGNDITGAGVNLGQVLEYVLTFENLGNDDATNYTIRDILPINVTLLEADFVLPPGVTYTYDPSIREVVFTIPDNLVEAENPLASIRMRVRVAENCFDFVDACTDQIANVAFSTYQGVINNAVISDDPSVNDFDACGFPTPGATNFLLDDLESCDFSRTVQICGDDVLLDAGNDFDSYVWYIDENEDGLIDSGDTLIVGADTDTLLVDEPGVYIVDKIVADPCKGFQEVITVTRFGFTQTNPIIDLVRDTTNTVDGEILVCSNDGEELPEIFLCGLNDTELLQINIPDADSIVWEQLDESSCSAADQGCANRNNTCVWNTVATGSDFNASDSGQYRVVINYSNGCFSRFFFNVFKNPLNPLPIINDIICDTPGNITVTNIPLDYEFQLIDATNDAILVPYSADNGPSFTITTNGAYRVEMRQQGVVDGCVFVLDNLGIRDRDFQVEVSPRDTDCNGLGEIAISVLNVEAQYYYEISQGGTTVDTFGPTNDNNYTFEDINDGVYDVSVTTDDGCDYTEEITVNDVSDLAVSAITTKNIDCEDGIITVSGSGGFPNPDYSYAIWSYVDEGGTTITSYSDISDIPANEFQSNTDFTFAIGEEGDYVFVIIDGNNCPAFSNEVAITVNPAADFDPTTVVNVRCFGEATGSITYNLVNSNGYALSYSLIPAADFSADNGGTTVLDGVTLTDDTVNVSSAIATNSSGIFTNLPAGDYVVVVNQSIGTISCDFIEPFTIAAPTNPLNASIVLVQDYTCAQEAIIEAQNVTGGTAPYEFSIDGINFIPDTTPNANRFENLTDGTYTVTVRDANDCLFTDSVTIDPLDPPTDLTFSASNLVCPALTSDVIVTAVNGNAPFVFEIIAPSAIAATSITGNSANFDGVSPGTYTFRVTDAESCVYEESFTIASITPITATGQLISNITCFDDTDGEARFTIANFDASFDYTVAGPSNFSGTAETNGTIDLTGLDDGTYSITVTDNDTSCSATATVTINAPPGPIALIINETQPTCTTDGSLQITASGGWGGYSYTLNNPDASLVTTNSNGAFNNLTQFGVYNGTVTDINGCAEPFSFELFEAIAPVLIVSANDLCYDATTGLELTATVTSGGDGNFVYSLNNGPFGASNTFAGLGPGTYRIDVRDGNNCTDFETITINPELSVTATAANITACGTDTDIDITAAGGDGNFVYAVVADGITPNAGDFSTTNPSTVNAIGDYDVYVRDNAGNTGFCEAFFDITIAQDPPIAINPAITNVSCFGGTNGAITINASGGESPYTFNIDGGTFSTTNTFQNLSAGNYIIGVRDANTCFVSVPVTITEPNQIIAEALITQNYTCTTLGEITVGSVTPTSGGTPPGEYQYSINGGAWSTVTTGGHAFTDLTDDTYSIRVRDANEITCFITLPDIIIAPLPAEPVLSFSVAYGCDGNASLTVLPADASYTYAIDTSAFQPSNVFNGVTPGNHTLTVNYGSNCTTSADVSIASGNAFDADVISFSNTSCNAGLDGSITFEIENFDASFEYQVNGGGFSTPQTTNTVTINSLNAGNYDVDVRTTDALGNTCTVSFSQTLSEPTPVIAAVAITTPVTCNDDAILTASASGGTPGYEYQLELNNGGLTEATYNIISIVRPFQSSVSFTGIPENAAGESYVVRVRDANGCIDTIDNAIVLTGPEIIAFDPVPTACYSGNNDGTIEVTVTNGNGGYLFQIDGGPWLAPVAVSTPNFIFENLGPGTYHINVRDSFGCEGTAISVTINPQLNVAASLQNNLTCLVDATIEVTANGGSGTYTYEWATAATGPFNNTQFTGNVFTTDTPGDYYFRVEDTTTPTACFDVVGPITVVAAATPVIASVNPTNILCHGESTGSLNVTIDTSIGNPPYTIDVVEINGPTNFGTQTNGLPAGDYEVTITDANGCESTVVSATITEPNVITPNITHTNLACSAGGNVLGTITVDATGGSPTYIYEINNNDFSVTQTYNTSSGTNAHTFTGLNFGDYTVTITDSNDCQTTATVTITTGPDVLITTAGAAGCLPGSGEMLVEAQASNGTLGLGNFFFALFPASPFDVADPAWFPEDPSPATANTHLFTGLTPGVTYTFIVYDTDTTCEYIQEATVPVASTSTLVSNINTTTNITCLGANDGTTQFTISGYGGTDVGYEVFTSFTNVSTGITGTISGAAGGPETGLVSNIPPGEYYILFTENSPPNAGCVTASESFIIQQAPALLNVIANSPTNDNCNVNAGVITAIGQFGTAPYDYQYLLDTDPTAAVSHTPPTATSAGWTSSTTADVEAGDYRVYVRDANNCIQFADVTVLLDPSPEISLAIVDECADEGTFEIVVTLDQPGVSTTTPPSTPAETYLISVNGGSFQPVTFTAGEYTVSNLSSGLGQSIAIRDLNGCGETEPIDIQTPLDFTVIQTVALDCEPGAAGNAEIEITVISGSGNYEYEINGPGTIAVARTVLPSNPFTWTGASAAGGYDVTVYDLGTTPPNCFETITVDVPNAVLPVFTETNTDVTCSGGADGTITLTQVDNGVSPLVYTITPMPTGVVLSASGNTFENLPAGFYDVRATGTNNCFSDLFNIEISEPTIIVVPNPTVVEFSCAVGNNVNNASITVNDVAPFVQGGSGTFVRYEFIEEDDPNTATVEAPNVVQSGSNTTFIETDLAGGVYTINVYDYNNCLGTTTAIIAPFDELQSASTTIVDPISCTNDGEDISINATSLITNFVANPANYEFRQLPSGSFSATNTFNDLAVGTHNFEVRNVTTGCIIPVSHTVVEPNTFTIDLVKLSDVQCFNTETGEITLELIDATYTDGFSWTIFNTNGTSDRADDTIYTGADATGSIATTGPTGTLNLSAGNYLIEITQTAFPECTNIETVTINGPIAPITGDRQVTDITCATDPAFNDGIIEVINVSGGWGDYQYYVSTTPIPNEFDDTLYGTNPRFEDLTAGTYEVWVIDTNGCPEQLTDVVLTNPTPILASLQINNFNCMNLEGEIEVVGVPATNPISGGQGSNYTYQLVRNGTNVGSPQNTPVFSNLGAGSYEVYIIDQWSCDLLVGPVVLTDAMSATAFVDKTIDCTINPGGQITITVNGGSSNLDFTVTYPDLTTTVSQNNGVFANLTQPGEYVFVVTDLDTATPCTVEVRQTLDDKVDPVLLNATIENVSCFGGSDGSITAVLDPATATNPNYTYELYRTSDLTTPIRVAQTSPLFDNLDADSYQVRVISGKSCEDIKTEIVTEPTQLVIEATATDFVCAADNSVTNSTLTVTVLEDVPASGIPSGTSPYLYSIDNVNFQTSNTFDIIDNGTNQTITVYVTDGEGCPATDTVTINALNTFTASVSQNTAISCTNPEQVTISVVETGAPGDVYTFELLPIPNTNGTLTSSTNTTATFDLSAVGSYTFRVTNSTTGCYVDTTPYEIAPFDLLDVVATATSPVSCFGTDTGALEINITGYSGNYNYQIFDALDVALGLPVSTDTSVNPRTIPNVPGGNYYVRITETDVPFCSEDSNVITIVSPAAALSTAVSIEAPPTCTDDQGEILVVPSGGFAPYDIILTNTTTGQVYNVTDVTSQLFTGLSAGSFTIEVSDSGAVPCLDNVTEVIDPAIPITASITATPTLLQCFGDTNATVSAISVLNGSGVYQYSLNEYANIGDTTPIRSSGFQVSPDFNNLGAGVYSITIADGWECDVTTVQVLIEEPTEVSPNLIQSEELTCTTNAELILTATEGTAPYFYFDENTNTWEPFNNGNSHTFTNVTPGDYQFVVRDINDCEVPLSNLIRVDPIPDLEIIIDDRAAFVNCTDEASATIIANVTGGLGNYMYELYRDAALTDLVLGPQTSNTFSQLPADSYYVRVISEDCESVSEVTTIVNPDPLVIETNEFTNITCFGEEDGTITVEVSGGTGEILYAITPNLDQFDSVNVFTDLAAGDYDVIAQDSNGCFIPFEFTIIEPSPISINVVSITNERCIGEENGSIEIEITGGTAPYNSSFNSNIDSDFILDQTIFNDIASGVYVIFVKDAEGCEENILVTVDPGVNLNATVTPIYECTGTITNNSIEVTLEDESISGDVLYALDSVDPSAMRLEADFVNIAPGEHFITIAYTNGCMNTIPFEIQNIEPLTLTVSQTNINEITATVTGGLESYTYYFNDINNGEDNTFIVNRTDTYNVRVVDQNGCEVLAEIFVEFIDIDIPDFFTPDGDGTNDFWIPENIEGFPNILTIIFDRYGRELYRMEINDAPWDGMYQGHNLPTGDYWYIIKLRGENDDREVIGHFTLLR